MNLFDSSRYFTFYNRLFLIAKSYCEGWLSYRGEPSFVFNMLLIFNVCKEIRLYEDDLILDV